MPSFRHLRWIALPSLGFAISVGQASANDRDLLATTVPASSCVAVPGSADWWQVDTGVLQANRGRGTYRCPLAINNVEISSKTSNDNDISKVRVSYFDNDGLGPSFVEVILYQTAILASGVAQSKVVCRWQSNTAGSGATGYTRATFLCPHDISPGAFYHFQVKIYGDEFSIAGAAGFAGIDFPQ